jgi:intein/homing endonuclease
VQDYHEWLVKGGYRSSGRYKNGVAKFSKFMLLGVAHGDYPDAYAEETKFLMNYCFPPFMEVLTEHGFKPISLINKGLRVWTHDNMLETVTDIIRRPFKGTLIKLVARHINLPILATPEHPILSVKAKKCKTDKICKPTMENTCIKKHCTELDFEKRKERLEKYQQTLVLSAEGLPQKQIAIKLQVPKSTIEAWVNSKHVPRVLKPYWKAYQPTWHRVSELEVGDFITIPIPPTIVKCYYSPEEMELFGLYVAEGCKIDHERNKGIAFTFGSHEDSLISRCKQLLESVYKKKAYVYENTGNSMRVILHKKEIKERYSCFGENATAKRVPHTFLLMPTSALAPFIRGLWVGDGGKGINRYKYTYFHYTTSSKTLAIQLFLILLKFGIISSIQAEKQSKRAFGEGNNIYRLTISGVNAQKLGKILGINGEYANEPYQYGFILGNYAYLPIKGKQKIPYSGYVFNLTVNNKQTYNCEGYPVHNCEVIGVPIAGLLSRVAGLSMTQRYDYVVQVMTKVLDVVGDSRVVQLMGFGLSKVSEISRIIGLAKKYDATLWVESSTIVRNSTHARKVLSLNIKTPDRIDYVNIAKVQGAEKFSTLDVFRENNKVLKGILSQSLLFNS